MIVDDARRPCNLCAMLDIGCGNGFDGSTATQPELARSAREYIGIEPDPEVGLTNYFSRIYGCRFEETPLPPRSVDLAFALMVLEHLTLPRFLGPPRFSASAGRGILGLLGRRVPLVRTGLPLTACDP